VSTSAPAATIACIGAGRDERVHGHAGRGDEHASRDERVCRHAGRDERVHGHAGRGDKHAGRGDHCSRYPNINAPEGPRKSHYNALWAPI
jgi:hypothetical protein